MNKNIVIIHYNTPRLTECLVRSINLFVKDAIIYIFDNSDKEPFTAKFDNVTVIDNTKGQIIDFDKWLENYPDRFKSLGRRSNFASAKHCYSIEKCMELIGKNFVLMDSDILLKKDISDFFDEECVYVGKSTFVGGYYNTNRVLPFICFINTEMCKENDISYFDDNYILGLFKTEKGDKYDTGGFFYLKTRDLKFKEININDYIVHYAAGSYSDMIGRRKPLTQEQWIEKNRKLWYKRKLVNNKKVVYTCITGDYDNLIEPTFITPDFDYVCFTDNLEIVSNVWDIRPLPKEASNLSQVKKQRYVKINTHKVLPEYDLSVWVDGSVTVKGDINVLLSSTLDDSCSVYVPKHPARKCIYAEAKAVVSMKKDISENVNPQMDRYREEGFPTDYGLLQSNIMIRKHNEPDCIKLMETWSDELIKGSHRDQLSFNYCCWKNKDVRIKYLDKYIYKSKWFNWNTIHKKKNLASSSVPHVEIDNGVSEHREKLKNIINTSRATRLARIKTNNIRIY